MSQFMDRDLFGGSTDREGWMFFARRRVTANVELRNTYFAAKAIEKDGPFLRVNANGTSALDDADRQCIQADASFSF